MPKSIGKYELKKKLGEGGFGVVYLARDTVLGDDVALKVAFAAEEHRASLLKEARLLRSLNHLNIVRVFEADLADDSLFIAMEYLPGGNLSERMAPGPLSFDETLGITRQLLAALHYAHGRSVLHRDVKPANVLFDAEGAAQLTDFGVARMLQHTQAASTRIGTVPYMAPEQLVGEAVFRSDLYAAGVLLYEMATGARAFEGDTDFIVMQKISNGQFKKPREANADIPPWLEDVIIKVMDRDPARRFATADDFGRALTPPAGAVTAEVEEAGGPTVETHRTKVVTKTTPAPDLVGQELGAAEAVVRDAGLVLGIGGRRPHASVVAGSVVEQEPAAGTPMNPGAAVDVVLSEGPEEVFVKVPDVTGVALGDAEKTATAAGFRLRVASRKYSGLPAGVVLNQRAKAGAKLAPGSTLAVAVSKGPKPARKFPAVNRRKAWVFIGAVGAAAAAVVILALAGVFSPERKARPEEVPAKMADSAVTTEEAEAALVTVTDVAGKGEKAARTALEETGFQVAVERRESPTVKKGVVIEQRPAGGEEVRVGAEVTLVVSAGKPAVKAAAPPGRETFAAVPRVAGMAEANARVRLANAGFGVRSVSRASDRVAAGYVIGQTPTGSGRRGATVTIYVSTGSGVKGAVYCPGCGAPRTPGAKFCGKCGYKFE
jgi:beta-lactam-binding protein with PASTA domain